MATGVLTVAVGRATRFLQYLTSEKEYKGVIRLGITTDTDDITGKIRTQDPVSWVKEKVVHISLQRFIGRIDQFPPRVSAIKKDGVRCYKLVRAEKDFEIAPRRVQIEQIDVQKFVEGNYPEVTIRVVCGGGTYIRSIARECGEALVVPLERVDSTCNLRNRTGDFCAGGTLAELVRTRSGIFTITNSLNLDEIRVQVEGGHSPLQSIESMLQHLPFLELSRQAAQRWLHGGIVTILADEIEYVEPYKPIRGKPIRIYHPSSPELLGIAQVDEQAHNEFVLRKRLFI